MLLIIHVEGQTEYHFVKKILESYLHDELGYDVSVRINPTSPTSRGGINPYNQFKQNANNFVKDAPDCIFTTMIDLYGLPNDFPGMEESAGLSGEKRVFFLEESLKKDLFLKKDLDLACHSPNIDDFIPYIQLYEFEALLFSDINQIDQICGRDGNSKTRRKQREKLEKILKKYRSPEQINDGKGPSRYLREIYGDFGKIHQGLKIAKAIGLNPMREACPHFNQWLEKLEKRAG